MVALNRHQAWTNILVLAINTGIERGIFGLDMGPDSFTYHRPDDEWPVNGNGGQYQMYTMEIDGKKCLVQVHNRYTTLEFKVCVNPKRELEYFPEHRSPNGKIWRYASKTELKDLDGDAYAQGTLERYLGKYLTYENRHHKDDGLTINKQMLKFFAELPIEPLGYTIEHEPYYVIMLEDQYLCDQSVSKNMLTTDVHQAKHFTAILGEAERMINKFLKEYLLITNRSNYKEAGVFSSMGRDKTVIKYRPYQKEYGYGLGDGVEFTIIPDPRTEYPGIQDANPKCGKDPNIWCSVIMDVGRYEKCKTCPIGWRKGWWPKVGTPEKLDE